MFIKGFLCGWVGMAAILIALLWGTTPRIAGTDYGHQPAEIAGYVYRDC